jgi:hypothetical protein
VSNQRLRTIVSAPVLVAGATLLSACTLTVSGSGTVTIESSDSATNSTMARVCAPGATSCLATDPFLYSYRPVLGSQIWIVTPGFPVKDRNDVTVGLPAGRYSLQATADFGDPSNVVEIDIFEDSTRDLTIWHQAYGRSTSESTCADGWQPSWAQWPNDGAGGFVCNRQIYAYYPDEPVR